MDFDSPTSQTHAEGTEGNPADRQPDIQTPVPSGEGRNVQKPLALANLSGAARLAEEERVKDMTEKRKQNYRIFKREIKVCPVCGEPLEFVGASSPNKFFLPFPDLNTSQRYACANCNYVGSVALNVKSTRDIETIKRHYEILKRQKVQPQLKFTQETFNKSSSFMLKFFFIIVVVMPVIYFLGRFIFG